MLDYQTARIVCGSIGRLVGVSRQPMARARVVCPTITARLLSPQRGESDDAVTFFPGLSYGCRIGWNAGLRGRLDPADPEQASIDARMHRKTKDSRCDDVKIADDADLQG